MCERNIELEGVLAALRGKPSRQVVGDDGQRSGRALDGDDHVGGRRVEKLGGDVIDDLGMVCLSGGGELHRFHRVHSKSSKRLPGVAPGADVPDGVPGFQEQWIEGALP